MHFARANSWHSSNNVEDIIVDVDNFTANSVFQNKEDINISEYYTVDEVNDLEIYKTPDDIVIVHINSVSLDKNYDSIKILLERMKPKPSIIFLSETKIPLSPSEIELNKIIFEGFHKPMLNNSPTKAGGTAIYVSETLSYNERPDLKFDFPECETCFVEVETNSCQNPIFGAMYRHPRPNEQAFTSHLEEFLEGFAVRGIKLTIMGDFNINLNQNNIVSREYIKSLHSLGFSALINQPTRYYTVEGSNYVGCSTLDHLITNSSETFSNVGILISDVTDHLPLFASMKLKNSKSNSFKNTYRRSFSDKKKEKFVKCLENHLENFDFSLDSNSLMDNFLLVMNNTINEVCPLKKVSRKQAQLLLNPWMTEEILKEIHIKDNLHKIYIKHRNKNSDDHKQWKKQRNKVNRLLTAAKNKDTENDCVKAKGNSAKMWKAINKATNQKPKSNVTPDFVKIRSPAGDLKKTKCKTEIANEMNRQFTQMGEKLASKLSPTNAHFSDYLKHPNCDSFFNKKASEVEVGNQVQDLDEGKSVGLDGIPPKVLKWASILIVPILTKIFNTCICEGVYPDKLKLA